MRVRQSKWLQRAEGGAERSEAATEGVQPKTRWDWTRTTEEQMFGFVISWHWPSHEQTDLAWDTTALVKRQETWKACGECADGIRLARRRWQSPSVCLSFFLQSANWHGFIAVEHDWFSIWQIIFFSFSTSIDELHTISDTEDNKQPNLMAANEKVMLSVCLQLPLTFVNPVWIIIQMWRFQVILLSWRTVNSLSFKWFKSYWFIFLCFVYFLFVCLFFSSQQSHDEFQTFLPASSLSMYIYVTYSYIKKRNMRALVSRSVSPVSACHSTLPRVAHPDRSSSHL